MVREQTRMPHATLLCKTCHYGLSGMGIGRALLARSAALVTSPVPCRKRVRTAVWRVWRQERLEVKTAVNSML